MSGFSADWLALRAPADDRARALDLVETATAGLAAPLVCDLGAGTGATLRALAPRIAGPHRWLLVDADADLLAEAARRFAAAPLPDVEFRARQADLVAEPAAWDEPPALVTASALFDLASAAWIGRFAAALAAARLPLLAMLTYDGRLEAAPAHPLDATMHAAFDAHQRSEKSFGPAAGPDAPQILAAAFAAHGYGMRERDTPWVLEAGRDDALIAATLEGWANAAREMGEAGVEDWLAARLMSTQRLLVGHRDQLFTPPAA